MYALSRILAAAACLVSGGIHLALVPGHTAGTPALAALFAAAGTALSLLGLALALDVGTRQVVRAASGTLAAVLVAYAVDRTVGLPLADAAEHAHGHAAGGADTLHRGARPRRRSRLRARLGRADRIPPGSRLESGPSCRFESLNRRGDAGVGSASSVSSPSWACCGCSG